MRPRSSKLTRLLLPLLCLSPAQVEAQKSGCKQVVPGKPERLVDPHFSITKSVPMGVPGLDTIRASPFERGRRKRMTPYPELSDRQMRWVSHLLSKAEVEYLDFRAYQAEHREWRTIGASERASYRVKGWTPDGVTFDVRVDMSTYFARARQNQACLEELEALHALWLYLDRRSAEAG